MIFHLEALHSIPSLLTSFILVQRVSDTSKGLVARLAKIEVPVFEDNEKTVADLQARIQKTIDVLKSVKVSHD